MNSAVVFLLICLGTPILVWVIRLSIENARDEAARRNAPPKPQVTWQDQNTKSSKAERLAQVDEFHDNDLNVIEVALADCGISAEDFSEAKRAVQDKTKKGQFNFKTGTRGADVGLAVGSSVNAAMNRRLAAKALEGVTLRRTLNEMDDGERAILRLADILHVLGTLDVTTLNCIQATIVWGGGKGVVRYLRDYSAADRSGLDAGLQVFMRGNFGDKANAFEIVQEALRQALSPDARIDDSDRRILEQYLFAGSRWLSPAEAKTSKSRFALKLGTFEGTNKDFEYEQRESLITIAPPGSGKSQAHVIRNLLHLNAPAVVLDIKGESFRNTARWRRENVGSIFAFAPGLPKASMHFNPLDGIRRDENCWDDARKLADLLVIPNNSDSYFENRGRDFLTTVLLAVALDEPEDRRNMSTVIDHLYLSDEELETWIAHLAESDVPMLRRQSNMLRSLPRKQREAILDSARNHLECWQSPALTSITDRSDWHPDMLRAQNGTLYLCISLEDLKKFAPVLRVILGQTIAALCKAEAESNAPIVTFFLDEFPRLGRMDVIEEGLDTARGHGVRFWMFCQNYGQLRTSYPNADGILANCAVRCFMDPDDDTAEELSRHLGERKGLIDGKKKRLAEATELKGQAFADKIIVFQRGGSPAKLVRRMAFEREAQAAE